MTIADQIGDIAPDGPGPRARAADAVHPAGQARSTSSPSSASTPTASLPPSRSHAAVGRSMVASPSDELAFALSLADAADAFTLPRFEHCRLHARLEGRPHRGHRGRPRCRVAAGRTGAREPGRTTRFFGEEHGLQRRPRRRRGAGSSTRSTAPRSFVRGIPVWATLIALTHVERGVVVGVVSAPALGDRRWWAAQGHGAFADGRAVPGLRRSTSLAEAQVSVTFNAGWDDARPHRRAGAICSSAPTGHAASATSGSTARRRRCTRPRHRRRRARAVRPRRRSPDRRGGGRHVHRPPRQRARTRRAPPSAATVTSTTR